jgi:putative DNA primase/helicase
MRKNPLKAVDLVELKKITFKPREPLLGPWLHSQDIAMVFAARGIGKTHFALSIAHAVATGSSFLGWSAPSPKRVVYLDGELPGVVMQQRASMHMSGVEPEPGYFRVFTPDLPCMDGQFLPDISTVQGQTDINEMIGVDTDLVIIDNLSAWARTGRENDAESWDQTATWLMSLRRRGIAVLIVHHAGKGGQQRGTSKREDLLDVVIKLSRPGDYTPSSGAVFTVEFSKARNLTGSDLQGLEVTLSGTSDRAEWSYKSVDSSRRHQIIELLKGGHTQSEAAEILGLDKSTVSRHARAAREDGSLTANQALGRPVTGLSF